MEIEEFGVLLEEQIPRLRRYARSLVRNPDLVDDLLQDTLLRALSKKDLWDPDTNLQAWIFTLMHNLNVNRIRQGIRISLAGRVDADWDLVSKTATDRRISTETRLLVGEIEDVIRRLKPEHMAVIFLIGYEGFTYEEAAEILQIPIGTVRSRISRGRLELRHQLGLEV